MKVVVSDATTLIVLQRIDRLDLLAVFAEVLVPPAVWEELARDYRFPAQVVRVEPVQDRKLVGLLTAFLDAGESEAIALAKERGLVLIIDEKKGRKAARRLGVGITGFLGLLLFATERKVLAAAEAIEIAERTMAAGMFIDEATFERFRRRL
jgi:predicted nucleic acid-binding protein